MEKKSGEKFTAEVCKNGNKEKTFSITKPYSSVSKVNLGNEFISDKYESNNRKRNRK